MASISSVELNYLVYCYLQESGFFAFPFFSFLLLLLSFRFPKPIYMFIYLSPFLLLFLWSTRVFPFAPTYSSIGMRKSDLRSSFLCVNQVTLFYLKGDHFKALDLKNDPFYLVRSWNYKLSKTYFCGRAWLGELILALVSP